jgi:hypothetical protein
MNDADAISWDSYVEIKGGDVALAGHITKQLLTQKAKNRGVIKPGEAEKEPIEEAILKVVRDKYSYPLKEIDSIKLKPHYRSK